MLHKSVSFLITVTKSNLKQGRFIGTHDLRRRSPSSGQGGHGSRSRLERLFTLKTERKVGAQLAFLFPSLFSLGLSVLGTVSLLISVKAPWETIPRRPAQRRVPLTPWYSSIQRAIETNLYTCDAKNNKIKVSRLGLRVA